MKVRSALLPFSLGLMAFAASAQLTLMRQPPPDPLVGAPARVCNRSGSVCAVMSSGESYVAATEASTGRVLRKFPVLNMFNAPMMAVSNDGVMLAFGGEDPISALQVWEISSGRRLFRRGRSMAEFSLRWSAIAFSSDGRFLALVSAVGGAEMWETHSWSMTASIDGLSHDAQELEVTADGKVLIYRADGTGWAWTPATGQIEVAASKAISPAPQPAPIVVTQDSFRDTALADFELTADGRLLIPGEAGRVFDLREGKLAAIPAPETYLGELDGFDASGSGPISAWDWTHAVLLDRRTLAPLPNLRWDSYRAMAVSPDGKRIAVRRRKQIVVIEVEDKSECVIDPGVDFDLMLFSRDGAALVVTGEKTTPRAFAVATGERVWLPALPYRGVIGASLHWALDWRNANEGSFVRLWEVARKLAAWELGLDAGEGAEFSTDEKLVAIPLRSGEIVVVETATARHVAVLAGMAGENVKRMRFTADGRRQVASSWAGMLRAWELASGRELLSLCVDKMEWAAASPSAFYDGTASELAGFYWTQGTHTLPLASQALQHHVPGLVALLWRGEEPTATEARAANALTLPDLPRLNTAGELKTNAQGGFTLEVRAAGAPAGNLAVMATRDGCR